jgi:high affinity Mn2+ porin
MPLKAAPAGAIYDWTGFYLGGHFGYGTGSLGPDTNAEPLQGAFFPHSVTGMIGGYQAGYNWQLTNRVVLGVEADISFGSPVDIPRLAPASFNTTIDYVATGRGRLGYAMGTWMPYVTGGVAWGTTHVALKRPRGNRATEAVPHACRLDRRPGHRGRRRRQLDRQGRIRLRRPRAPDL